MASAPTEREGGVRRQARPLAGRDDRGVTLLGPRLGATPRFREVDTWSSSWSTCSTAARSDPRRAVSITHFLLPRGPPTCSSGTERLSNYL